MENQKRQEIIVSGQEQHDSDSHGAAQATAQPAEKKRWKFSGFGWKKWVLLAVVVVAVCFIDIISVVVKNFLFFNEYSFELAAADGSYWEVELDAFGNVTSIEQEGWH